MAIKMNKVVLSCNLVKDPEFKKVGDKTVAGLYIAHNDRKDQGHFFSVEAWASAARACERLKKGDPCIIVGRLAQDRWEDKDGNNRQAVKIVARQFLYVNRQVDLNMVTISCNVASDPNFKNVGNGENVKTVMDMRVACNGRGDNANFFSVEAWNGLAKSCETLLKGSRLVVEGRLALDQWKDDEGKSHSIVKIVGSDIHFVNKPKKANDDNDGARHFD